MNKKITAFLAAWLLIAIPCAKAQTGITLTGKITAADGKPIPAATVCLLRVADSVLIKTALTGGDGSYLLAGIKPAAWKLRITAVGYLDYMSKKINPVHDTAIPIIILQPRTTTLKEVAVIAQRPLIEHLIDRTVVNVDALVSNAGSTALDVLEKSPGVMVDQNGAISLQGKSGVTIFIDDKPTYLSGDDLANYLRSLSSSSIDRIELMSNPPAKYDAAGNGGVINIRLKRIREAGFNGNLNLAYLQGTYTRTSNSINLNYRHNKLNVAANFGYSPGDNFNDVAINRYFDTTITGISPNFMQRSFVKRQLQNDNASLSIDYYATAKTTVGIGFTGLISQRNSYTTDVSQLTSAQQSPDSTIIAYNQDKRRFANGGVNANYRHEYDKKGTELTADLDYLSYKTHIGQRFDNNSFYPDGTLYYKNLQTGDLPSNIDIWSVKTDYTRSLANKIKLSTGLKTSFTRTDNIANYFNIVNQAAIPDYDETNHFIYRENINAAYINASKDLKRWSVQAGLRFENTIANGHQLGNAQKPDSSFSRNYNSLFPTFYVQYKLDSAGHQQLSFNYGRRVDRPYYASLNPFLSPLDKFTYNTGNPFLLPSYSDNLELSYTWRNITATAYYSHIRDKVDGLVQIINGYYYSQPGNIGNTWAKGIEIDGSVDAAKWFNIHIYARMISQHTVTNFYTGPLDTKGVGYFIRPVLTFRPGRNWTIQADGSYRSRLVTEQFIDGVREGVNAAVSKKVSAAATLKLVVNDLFKTFDNNWQIGHLAGTQANFWSVADTRCIVLSFSWRFGSAIKGQRKHEANGAQSEQNRANN